MSLCIAFLAVSSLFLALSFLGSEIVLRRFPVAQDMLWRTTLILLAILPGLLWVRNWSAVVAVPISLSDIAFNRSLLTGSEKEPESTKGIGPTNHRDEGSAVPLPPPKTSVFSGSTSHALNTKLNAGDSRSLGANPEVGTSSDRTSTPSVNREGTQFSEIGNPINETVASRSMQVAAPLSQADWSRWFIAIFIGSLTVVSLWRMVGFLFGWYLLRSVTHHASKPRSSHSGSCRWTSLCNQLSTDFQLNGVSIRFSPRIASPMLGAGRNCILIPSWMRDETAEPAMRQILRHELMHLHRRDHWFQWLLSLLGTVLWMNPLYFWMKRRMVWLREIICDAHVAIEFDPIDYAETLLALTQRRPPLRSPMLGVLGVTMASPKSQLARRIQAILHESSFESLLGRSRPMRSWIGGLALLAVVSVVLLREASPRLEAATTKLGNVLKGQVKLADGTPAKKASIHLWERVEGGGGVTLPAKTITTKTDDQGEFQIPDVAKGRYSIWAETRTQTSLTGFLRGESIELKEDADFDKPVALVTHPSCRYVVRVKSKETGKPIPDAHISFGWPDIERDYVTNAEGAAGISGLAENEWYFVVKADGYAMEHRKVPKQPMDATVELEFELNPGAKVKGVVVDEEGKPVPEVQLFSSSRDDGSMTPGYGSPKTDKTGAFQLSHLPFSKRIELHFNAEGFLRSSESFFVTPNETMSDLRIQLTRRPYGGDCLVKVTDPQGAPIKDAAVVNHGDSTAEHRDVKTDESGLARVRDLFKGHRGYLGFVRAPGFITQEVQLVKGSVEEPGELHVTLLPGKTIRGRLVDPDGKPGSKIRVYYNQGEQPWNTGGRVDCDADGRFVIDGLPDDSTFTFYTIPPYAPIRGRSLPVGQNEEILVTMEYEAVIRLRAIDEDTGKPIPEFNVKIGFTEQRKPGDIYVPMNSNLFDPGTDILGDVKEFRLGQLLKGAPFQLIVSAKGYEKKVLKRVEATLEKDSEPIEVRLTPEDPALFTSVAGILKDTNGTPIKGAIVRLVSSERSPTEARWDSYRWSLVENGQCKNDSKCVEFLTVSTNDQGRFRFPRVRIAGWMELFCSGTDTVNSRHVIADPTKPKLKSKLDDLSLTAAIPASLKVTVAIDQYPDARHVRLWPRNATNALDLVFESMDGHLSNGASHVDFKGIPPGDFLIELYGQEEVIENGLVNEKSLGKKSIQVEAGEALKIEFD